MKTHNDLVRASITAMAVALTSPATVLAEGLSGPSSVQADLTPGDGLTDPQFRSDFPQYLFPGWFSYKQRVVDNSGFKLKFDYLSLSQASSSSTGVGHASGGIARFYGSWAPKDSNGSITFKIENRHAYGSVAPQFLGLDGGALAITGTAFNDIGTALTNLFYTYRDPDGAWTFQVGQLDVTDFVDIYGLVSPYTAFQNLAFNTNPTINAPNPGLGIAGGARLGKNFYVVGSVADANADPSSPDLTVFSDGNLFSSLEVGYTSSLDRVYFDNVHLTVWHSDAAENGSRLEDYGAAFSGAWFIDNTWMPFLRAGVSEGTAALYEKSLSTGVGYYHQNTDLAGIGLNWAQGNGVMGTQFTAEAFYRFTLASGFQVTPSIQYISNPLLNPAEDGIAVVGLRTRIVF